jgi:hypothetical protein
MQSTVLNYIGQYIIVENTSLLVNINRIYNFHETVSGVGNLYREYSWSVDKTKWSYWNELTQSNLLQLSSESILPISGFYIKFKYTLISPGTVSISDIGIDVELIESDPTKGYIPYGITTGNFACTERSNTHSSILSMCNSTFNPYQLNNHTNIYKEIVYGLQNLFGHQVTYIRSLPVSSSEDVIFKEWTLYQHDEPTCTKVIVPDNTFPDAGLKYNPWGVDYETPFEVHIVKKNFEETFGVDAAPQSRDVIYFDILPDRLYEVKSSTPVRDMMLQTTYWKVELMKYESKSNTYTNEDVDALFADIKSDSESLFGEKLEIDIKDITKPQQYDRLIGDELRDPVRRYINKDLHIIEQQILNHGHIIANSYYDLSSIHDVNTTSDAIEYYAKSTFSESQNFAFSCWAKDTSLKYTVHKDAVKTLTVSDNIITVEIKAIRNYKIGHYINVYRQGRLNFYGKVINIVSTSIFEIEVQSDVIDYLNSVSTSWASSPGWICEMCFENIYIDGIGIEQTTNETKGWKITQFANRFIEVQINDTIHVYVLGLDLESDWFGLFFNYSAEFKQMNFNIWKMKTTRNKTTDLDNIYTKTFNNINLENKYINTNYKLMSSNTLITNIRIYNDIVESNKQPSLLNQNIVEDASKIVIADNAISLNNLTYVGNTK